MDPELPQRQTGEQRPRQSEQWTEGSGERLRPGTGSSQTDRRQESFRRRREGRETGRSIETHQERAGLTEKRKKLDRVRERSERHMK